jgi:hypothetical protein
VYGDRVEVLIDVGGVRVGVRARLKVRVRLKIRV